MSYDFAMVQKEIMEAYVYDFDYKDSCRMRAYRIGDHKEWCSMIHRFAWLKREFPHTPAAKHANTYIHVLERFIMNEEALRGDSDEDTLGSQDTWSTECSEHTSDREFIDNKRPRMEEPVYELDLENSKEELRLELQEVRQRFVRWEASVVHTWQVAKLNQWLDKLEEKVKETNLHCLGVAEAMATEEREMLREFACPLEGRLDVKAELEILRGGADSEIHRLLDPLE